MSEVRRYEFELFHCNRGDMSLDAEGTYVTYEDYAALQQKLDAVVAENAALSRYVSASAGAVEHWNSWADNEDKLSTAPETPATDDIFNAVRAGGIDIMHNIFINRVEAEHGPNGDDTGLIKAPKMCVTWADMIRAAAPKGDSE